MKTILLFALIFYTTCFFAQKEQNVKKIEFDYSIQNFKDTKVFRSLKVNDWVSITMINIPKNKNISSSVIFTNRNLESMDNFKNYIAFSDENTTGNLSGEKPTDVTVNPLPDIEGNEDKNEAKKNELQKNFPKQGAEIQEVDISQSPEIFDKKVKNIFENDSSKSNKKVDEILNKEYKVNESNAIKALEITIVKRFIEKYIEKNPNGELKDLASNAKDDYEWQKRLIGYLQANMNNKIRVRDSLINVKYEENQKLTEENIKLQANEATHNLPIVKIQNFDSTEFNIIIEDKDKKNKELITFPFRNNGGFKLDFSTGFIISGLYDDKYDVRQGMDSNYVQIKEEISAKLNLGITLLAHAYFRSTDFINPAITSGLSVNLGNQSLNYILGGSILLGEDQRFIISSGLILGKVKTLPNYYKTDDDISVDILPISSQSPVVDKMKTSWFLGITYNLGISGKNKVVQLN